MADMFIVDWFGDLPVILDDQSQSAAIRTRLVERVRWLHERGRQDVVLVAHSGGTIVSYATLLRYDQTRSRLPSSSRWARRSSSDGGWRMSRGTGSPATPSAAT